MQGLRSIDLVLQLYNDLLSEDEGRGKLGVHALIHAIEKRNKDSIPTIDLPASKPDPLELHEADLQQIQDRMAARLGDHGMSSSKLWTALDVDTNGTRSQSPLRASTPIMSRGQ